MSATLWSVSSANGYNSTINGSITNTDVTIVLTTATNLPAGGGILVIDRVNSSGTSTPTVREYISYTGISTNTVTGVTRGVGGSTAQSHSSGAIIEEVLSVTHWLDLLAFLAVAHDTSGNIDTIGASTSLTTPKINENVALLSTSTELNLLDNITALVTTSSTDTFTNKRITQRVITTTDDATAVINCAITDQYELSAVANATEFTVTGTPTDGQKLLIRWKDAGAAKNLTFTGFTAIGCTIPTTTVQSKWGYVFAVYNLAATTWHVLAVGAEA